MRLLCLAVTALWTACPALALPTSNTTSTGPLGYTLNGTYEGYSIPSLSGEAFLGIPFAHAPRLTLAQSLNTTWNDTLPATTFGLTCPGFGTNNREGWEIGEDCLNLDIARPLNTSAGDDLPVIMWIYGGGFSQGAIRDPLFNLSYMVQTSVEIGLPTVFVAVNSRLSGFGYLNGEVPMREGVSNLGLRDVWKGLEWINENIAGFGGDKDKVTIYGESSGGLAVELLAHAYGGQNSGLFRAGMISSVTAFSPFMTTIARQEGYFAELANVTGCDMQIDILQCLRDLPLETYNSSLYAVNSGSGYRPIIDGDFFKNAPGFNFKNKKIAPIALLIGANSDEGLSTFQTNANTTEELAALTQTKFGLNESAAMELVELYAQLDSLPPYSQPLDIDWVDQVRAAGGSAGNASRIGYAMGGDWSAISGRRKNAQLWSNATNGAPVYSYRFDTDATRFPIPKSTTGLGLGFAEHGSDLSFDFRLPYAPYTPYLPVPQNVTSMKKVAYAMQATYLSFAATLSPNNHGLDWIPEWPEYSVSQSNFVYNATLDDTLNLHVEKDNWREEQMEWFIERWEWLLTQGAGF